jgi:hypothetical protein
MVEKQLVSVKTGEPYQPVRIYYQVAKKKTVLGALQKLKCIEFDADQERWNWLYEDEAKKLRFMRSHNALSKADRLLILGYFTFRGEDQMLLDVRSIERAIAGLEFFEKRINRWAAKPTHLRLVNRFFRADEMPYKGIHPTLDPFFDRDNVRCLAREMMAEFDRISAEYEEDSDAKQQAWAEYMKKNVMQRHPEIEEMEINLHEEDLAGLSMALHLRQREAFEHWRGNFTYNPFSALSEFAEAIADEFGDDLEDLEDPTEDKE